MLTSTLVHREGQRISSEFGARLGKLAALAAHVSDPEIRVDHQPRVAFFLRDSLVQPEGQHEPGELPPDASKVLDFLERTGASLKAYTDPVVKYHPKYLVADEGPAVVASLNFTRKCFRKTCDALVLHYGTVEPSAQSQVTEQKQAA